MVPTIHVSDLAAFVANIATSAWDGTLEPLAPCYVAVDAGAHRLSQLGAAVSSSVGGGGVVPVTTLSDWDTAYPGISGVATVNDLMRHPDPSLVSALLSFTQQHVVIDTASLAMHSHPVVGLKSWVCQGGPPTALALLRDEYAAHAGHVPMRVCMVGPPMSGKSTTAVQAARAHGLQLVSLTSAVEAVTGGSADLRELSDGTPARAACLQALKDAVTRYLSEASTALAAGAVGTKAGSKAPAAGAAGTAAPAATTTAKPASKDRAAGGAATAAAGESVAAAGQKPSGPRLPLALLSRVVRAVLTSPAYRNTGWVLDGVPRSAAEAAALFEVASPCLNEAGVAVDDADGIMPPARVLTALGLSTGAYAPAFPAPPASAPTEPAVAAGKGVTASGKKASAEGGAAGTASTGSTAGGKKGAEAPKVDPAFITASLAEEAEADMATLAALQATGATVNVMGKALPAASLAATAVAPHPKLGAVGKSGSVAAIPGTPRAGIAEGSAAAVNYRLLPHVLARLEASHDMALLQRVPAAATPEDRERFERKLRRYRIHNAPGTAVGVDSWFRADHPTDQPAPASVLTAASTTSLELNTNGMSQAGMQQAIAMALTDARSAALRRAHQHDPTVPKPAAPLAQTIAAVGAEMPWSAPAPTMSAAQSYIEQQLDERTAPTRAALMAELVPHLSAGIVAVCSSNPPPDNPVLALAQYLMRIAEHGSSGSGRATVRTSAGSASGAAPGLGNGDSTPGAGLAAKHAGEAHRYCHQPTAAPMTKEEVDD